MRLIQHIQPKLNIPKFLCDEPLCNHLDDDPLLKLLNKRFIACSIGVPGSGKTSLLISLLTTPNKFKKVFHKIYVFMPSTSRDSMKNNIFNELPQEQLFEGVDFDNLNYVYNQLLENKKKGLLSLLIFDDVQMYLKDKEVELNVLHIGANSRHLKASMWFCVQNYNKIPQNLRKIYTDLFLFDISKVEYDKIFDENIELEKSDWLDVIRKFRDIRKEQTHSFIYIHEKHKVFINWNEIILEEENNI